MLVERKRIGVFCGSNIGERADYLAATKHLAKHLVQENLGVVYGGGKVGLMGVLADEVLRLGGQVIGVIPRALVEREVAHDGLSELHIVDTMHERKVLMAELSDSFVLLPGGAGSLDEFFEVFTLGQLGYFNKPCGILNVSDYYAHLIEFINYATKEGFLKEEHRARIIIDYSPRALLEKCCQLS